MPSILSINGWFQILHPFSHAPFLLRFSVPCTNKTIIKIDIEPKLSHSLLATIDCLVKVEEKEAKLGIACFQVLLLLLHVISDGMLEDYSNIKSTKLKVLLTTPTIPTDRMKAIVDAAERFVSLIEKGWNNLFVSIVSMETGETIANFASKTFCFLNYKQPICH